jgi:hypothetical protein
MTRRTLAVLGALLLPLTAVHAAADKAPRTIAGVENPYRTDAFAEGSDPMPAIDAALAAAQASGKRVLLVMGMNGCHDSAWLANLVASERFAPVRDRYHIVFADIGMPHRGIVRNAAVPKRFGFRIRGTPTVAVLDADGKVLNRKAAPKWRNAASRSDDAIYDELMQ